MKKYAKYMALAVTLALDAFALAVWGTEKGKSGADA